MQDLGFSEAAVNLAEAAEAAHAVAALLGGCERCGAYKLRQVPTLKPWFVCLWRYSSTRAFCCIGIHAPCWLTATMLTAAE